MENNRYSYNFMHLLGLCVSDSPRDRGIIKPALKWLNYFIVFSLFLPLAKISLSISREKVQKSVLFFDNFHFQIIVAIRYQGEKQTVDERKMSVIKILI